MENFSIINLLNLILDKEYSIVKCLPIDLQDVMNEIISNIETVYKQLSNIEYVFNNTKPTYDFLDMVTLYQELNDISGDLGTCMLFLSKNFLLEDANFNLEYIMNELAKNDCVFRYCYNKSKIRI